MSLSQQPVGEGPSMSENNKSCIFYKLMEPSILQDKKLKIPDKFDKQLSDELSSVSSLAVPGGRQWLVELREDDNKSIWLESGWNAFVEYYSICIGYFMVFKYEGNSHFDVHKYNLKASGINYRESSSNPVLKDIEDGDFVEITGSRPTRSSSYILIDEDDDECLDDDRRKYMALCGLQDTFRSTRDKGIDQFSEIDFQISKGMNNRSFRGAELSNSKPNKSGKKIQKFDHNRLYYESASARKRTVTAEEREKAINAAKSFESKNPFCRVVLRPSYIYRGCIMYLPSRFAKKYLSEVSGCIKLQVPDGRQWDVQCLYRGGNAKFSRGWYEFASENNLEEGDVCVFEILRSKEFVMKVTVFRVMENAGLMRRSQ